MDLVPRNTFGLLNEFLGSKLVFNFVRIEDYLVLSF